MGGKKKWDPLWTKVITFFTFSSSRNKGVNLLKGSFASCSIDHICWDSYCDPTTINNLLLLGIFLGYSTSDRGFPLVLPTTSHSSFCSCVTGKGFFGKSGCALNRTGVFTTPILFVGMSTTGETRITEGDLGLWGTELRRPSFLSQYSRGYMSFQASNRFFHDQSQWPVF